MDNAFRADTRNLTPETKSQSLIHLAALRQRRGWSLITDHSSFRAGALLAYRCGLSSRNNWGASGIGIFTSAASIPFVIMPATAGVTVV